MPAIPFLDLQQGRWSAGVTYSFENIITTTHSGFAWSNPTAPGQVFEAQFDIGATEYRSVSGLQLTRVAAGGLRANNIEIGFGANNSTNVLFGLSTAPNGWPAAGAAAAQEAGNIMFNSGFLTPGTVIQLFPLDWNRYAHTAIHELGHSLGLKHTFDGSVQASALENDPLFSVMAYPWNGDRSSLDRTEGIRHLMLYDIAQIQAMYGANTSFHSTDDSGLNSYRFMFAPTNATPLSAAAVSASTNERNLGEARAIWDAGGVDTFDLSAAPGTTDGVLVNIGQGQFSAWSKAVGGAWRFTVSVAFDTLIENAIGTDRDDIVIGNQAQNDLRGKSGSDRIFGDTVVAKAFYDSNGQFREPLNNASNMAHWFD